MTKDTHLVKTSNYAIYRGDSLNGKRDNHLILFDDDHYLLTLEKLKELRDSINKYLEKIENEKLSS